MFKHLKLHKIDDFFPAKSTTILAAGLHVNWPILR